MRPLIVWHHLQISTIRRAAFIVASPGLVQRRPPRLKPTRLASPPGVRWLVSGVGSLASSLDSFKSLRSLSVGGDTYDYFSLPEAEKNGLAHISRLPFSPS